MSEPLPPPWIAFPELQREGYALPEGIEHFGKWLLFYEALPRDEQRQYERDYPAPAEWEIIYEHQRRLAALRKDQDLLEKHAIEVGRRIDFQKNLIAKLWQSTTLK